MTHPYRTSAPPPPDADRRKTLDAALLSTVLCLLSLALSSAALAAGCLAPSQRSPSRFGVVRVALADSPDGVFGWSQHQRVLLDPYINVTLDALGPDFQLVDLISSADVLVRATGAMPDGACGLYRAGDAEARVNSACAQGDDGLRRAVGHELLHWLTDHRFAWVGHLCEWPVNAPVPPGCHPTLRCVDCVLSPGLRAPDETGPTFTEAYVPPIADPVPAQADLDLIDRCDRQRACLP